MCVCVCVCMFILFFIMFALSTIYLIDDLILGLHVSMRYKVMADPALEATAKAAGAAMATVMVMVTPIVSHSHRIHANNNPCQCS